MGETSTDHNHRKEANSLGDRLRFAQVDQGQTDLVRHARTLLLPHVRNGLRDHFERMQSFPHAARHFSGDDGQVAWLQDLKSSHWDGLMDARFDSLYAERVKILTDTESGMGMDPRWMMADHAVVLEHLIIGILEDMWPKSLLGSRQKAMEKACQLAKAVMRIVFLDAEITMSLRFNELRVTHHKSMSEQRQGDHEEARALLGTLAKILSGRDFSRQVSDINNAITAILGRTDLHAADISEVSSGLSELGEVMSTGMQRMDLWGQGSQDLHGVILELGDTIRQFHISRIDADGSAFRIKREASQAPPSGFSRSG